MNDTITKEAETKVQKASRLVSETLYKSCLPEEYIEVLLKYMYEDSDVLSMPTTVIEEQTNTSTSLSKRIESAILRVCTWTGTRQGHSFWEKVYRNYKADNVYMKLGYAEDNHNDDKDFFWRAEEALSLGAYHALHDRKYQEGDAPEFKGSIGEVGTPGNHCTIEGAATSVSAFNSDYGLSDVSDSSMTADISDVAITSGDMISYVDDGSILSMSASGGIEWEDPRSDIRRTVHECHTSLRRLTSLTDIPTKELMKVCEKLEALEETLQE